ncbi:HipA domain-containing protein [Phenylobacterium sp.]|uniref:type II toxin-antitoxin system HipA family toxin n=1 Tax=Phenylobacterium sp. TaxID=1871053 RepID=UPI001228FDED|nr:HipA domain-containing protein [Phenylobacterium sp.]THD64879.1 MAG: type II toxin-antitoxin system HipA family toxin [Phenylobacterium sp.]
MTTLAQVRLWDTPIGAVSLPDDGDVATFAYTPEFQGSGIEIAPLMMPLGRRTFSFPELPRRTFHGLPGLLADSLPDRYGNLLVDAWLASQGRLGDSFNAVERLCYTGSRGMGALEFAPAQGPNLSAAARVDVGALVELASEVLSHRADLQASFAGADKADGLRDILRVGTSAGGARAKAVIAWNRETNEVRSGQVAAGEGFSYWLLKFDGVTDNRDKEFADPKGFGAVEYAYSKMARAAGITMTETRLLEENGRRHFMTERFDRLSGGGKLHVQTLTAMAHYDFNNPVGYAYEQAMLVIRQLGLPTEAVEEQYRRMVFNVVARNQDDHVKNISFLMDRTGAWSLSPAYDITWSFNPTGEWTQRHQMSVNGKRDGFEREDFEAAARAASLSAARARTIVQEVRDAVAVWPSFAEAAMVSDDLRARIDPTLRLTWD